MRALSSFLLKDTATHDEDQIEAPEVSWHRAQRDRDTLLLTPSSLRLGWFLSSFLKLKWGEEASKQTEQAGAFSGAQHLMSQPCYTEEEYQETVRVVTSGIGTMPMAQALDTMTMAKMSKMAKMGKSSKEWKEDVLWSLCYFDLTVGPEGPLENPKKFCWKGQWFVLLASRASSQQSQLPPTHSHRLHHGWHMAGCLARATGCTHACSPASHTHKLPSFTPALLATSPLGLSSIHSLLCLIITACSNF